MLRRSCPVIAKPSFSVVTTSRTTNPYGSVFGRPLKFGGPGDGSGPLKAPAVAGNLDFRCATSTFASAPSNADE